MENLSVPVCTPNRGVYKEADKHCGRVSGCVDVCMCIRKTFYVSFSCQSQRQMRCGDLTTFFIDHQTEPKKENRTLTHTFHACMGVFQNVHDKCFLK